MPEPVTTNAAEGYRELDDDNNDEYYEVLFQPVAMKPTGTVV